MSTTVYILTEEFNEYDQHGEYFRACFIGKPSIEKLSRCEELKGCSEEKLRHILNGGGRKNGNEYCWYNLNEEKAL